MWNRLTPRERDVLFGIAREQSNKQIAESLGIGVGTVKAHVKRMFLKLGVHERALAPLVALGELERAAKLPRAIRSQSSRRAS
jgi:DNA-binding NarL/FixJ family response regulator